MLCSVRDTETFTKLYDDQFKAYVKEKEFISYGLNDSSIFEYYFYVTTNTSHGSTKKFRGAYQQGRPNMNQFFQEVCDYSTRKEVNRIGAIVSGPFVLVDEVQNVCASFRRQARIDVHEEYFSF